MKGSYIGFYLVLVLGFGNQHARDKGAECQTQAGQLG